MSEITKNAEKSKDHIIDQVDINSASTTDILLTSIYTAVAILAINYVVLFFLLIILTLIVLVLTNVISTQKALIVVLFSLIFLIIIAIIFVYFIYDYSAKHLTRAQLIFDNFVASQDSIDLLSGAFDTYRISAGIP